MQQRYRNGVAWVETTRPGQQPGEFSPGPSQDVPRPTKPAGKFSPRTWPLRAQLVMALVVIVVAASVSATADDMLSSDRPAVLDAASAPTVVVDPTPPTGVPTTASVQATDSSTSLTTPITAPTDGASTVPTTTAAPAVTTTPVGGAAGVLLARTVLDSIPVAVEQSTGYSRDFFPTWSSTRGGCDVRDEVLIDESNTPVRYGSGCSITSGLWISIYDTRTLTDPSDVDIDHVVPLKEAWDSGAWSWTPARRVAYSNDLSDDRTLIAVSASSNRSKADKDPSNWLPQAGDVCRYLGDWVSVKARWGLSMDQSEWGRIKSLLEGQCLGSTVAPWSAAPGR